MGFSARSRWRAARTRCVADRRRPEAWRDHETPRHTRRGHGFDLAFVAGRCGHSANLRVEPFQPDFAGRFRGPIRGRFRVARGENRGMANGMPGSARCRHLDHGGVLTKRRRFMKVGDRKNLSFRLSVLVFRSSMPCSPVLARPLRW
jgi:hypothetical protein